MLYSPPDGYIDQWFAGALELICREIPIGISDGYPHSKLFRLGDVGYTSYYFGIVY